MRTKITQAAEIKLNSYDQLFGETKDPDIQEVYLTELHDFPKHPFQVKDDEDMAELVQSIREKGVLTPIIVRQREAGGYEVISGHRRKHAAQLVGLIKIPASVRELSDEDAVDIMIYCNFQRSSILPSEKAFAYRLQMETIRHAGKKGKSSPQLIGEKYGDHARKVQRYIRLTYLELNLLELVDCGRLTLQAGYALSFLPAEAQSWVWNAWLELKRLPAGNVAEKIRSLSEDGVLTEEKTKSLIGGETSKPRVFKLKRSLLEKYIPKELDDDQIEVIISNLLKKWREEHDERWEE